MPRRRFLALLSILIATVFSLGPAGAQTLAQVEQLVDSGQPGRALDTLGKLIQGGKPTPEQLMWRGTARLMLGELKEGAADLERALSQNPKLRQGWVNLGGLEIAEGNYEAAEKAFRKAYQLAPNRPDSHLNLGAALMLLQRKSEAQAHFKQYLQLEGGSAEAHYLVATNYALGDVETEAVAALEEAVRQDERMRMRARRDNRFALLDSLDYRVLLNTDPYVPPADHHQVEAAFRQRYERQEGVLLYAVLEALRGLDVSYDPEVEAAAKWAIVWGDLRIKLRNQGNGTGVVSLSAPPDRYTSDQFHSLSQRLFREIHKIIGQ